MGESSPADAARVTTVGMRYFSEGMWLLTCQPVPSVISTMRLDFEPATRLVGVRSDPRTSGFSALRREGKRSAVAANPKRIAIVGRFIELRCPRARAKPSLSALYD